MPRKSTLDRIPNIQHPSRTSFKCHCDWISNHFCLHFKHSDETMCQVYKRQFMGVKCEVNDSQYIDVCFSKIRIKLYMSVLPLSGNPRYARAFGKQTLSSWHNFNCRIGPSVYRFAAAGVKVIELLWKRFSDRAFLLLL